MNEYQEGYNGFLHILMEEVEKNGDTIARTVISNAVLAGRICFGREDEYSIGWQDAAMDIAEVL